MGLTFAFNLFFSHLRSRVSTRLCYNVIWLKETLALIEEWFKYDVPINVFVRYFV